MQKLSLLVSYRGYGGSSLYCRGPVQEISLHLAKEARSKCKGRMTDSSLEGYNE